MVMEVLNLSQLRGYRTGGTIHLIINNQVGFTTGPSNSRSTHYATDVAKGYQVPVFHVNGDDPEAVVRIARLAFDYRERFNQDVIIDMVCYRRRGHNEGDDPSMTQPLMYNLIEAKNSVRKLYTETLASRGDISDEEAAEALQDYQNQLERVFTETREGGFVPPADTEPVAGLSALSPSVKTPAPWSDGKQLSHSQSLTALVMPTSTHLPDSPCTQSCGNCLISATKW